MLVKTITLSKRSRQQTDERISYTIIRPVCYASAEKCGWDTSMGKWWLAVEDVQKEHSGT